MARPGQSVHQVTGDACTTYPATRATNLNLNIVLKPGL